MGCRVVEKNSVGILVMFTKALAMISGDDNDGIFVPAALFHKRQEMSQRGVCIGNLAVVQMIIIGLIERSRRLVGVVRIVKMHPNEVRALRMRSHPCLRVL